MTVSIRGSLGLAGQREEGNIKRAQIRRGAALRAGLVGELGGKHVSAPAGADMGE